MYDIVIYYLYIYIHYSNEYISYCFNDPNAIGKYFWSTAVIPGLSDELNLGVSTLWMVEQINIYTCNTYMHICHDVFVYVCIWYLKKNDFSMI